MVQAVAATPDAASNGRVCLSRRERCGISFVKSHLMNRLCLVAVCVLIAVFVSPCPGQLAENKKYKQGDLFRQLEELFPTANSYRTASGAPGHEYWQQRADYSIDVELDDEKQRIIGSETIKYHNNSPDTLSLIHI